MGIYLNPEDKDKESWLQENATEVSEQAIKLDYNNLIKNKEIPIVLMNMDNFSAAGICHKKSEFDYFSQKITQLKRFYVVPLSKLKEELLKNSEGQYSWSLCSKYFE